MSVAVCIPARNEEATVGRIVGGVRGLQHLGHVDEVVVADDGSSDATAALARLAGATLVPVLDGPGKGQALRAAIRATSSDLLVFLDGDVSNFSPKFVRALTQPLLTDPHLQLVKATYRRSCNGQPDEGGRVTELLARPVLRHFFPELADISQPLSGECAIRRRAIEDIGELADGYGIEIALLIDTCTRFGRSAIAEVDLGERVHRNRPLRELRTHADDIVSAVFARTSPVFHLRKELT